MSLIFKRVMALKSVSFAQSANLTLTDFNFQFIIQTVKPQPRPYYFQGQETLPFKPRTGWFQQCDQVFKYINGSRRRVKMIWSDCQPSNTIPFERSYQCVNVYKV